MNIRYPTTTFALAALSLLALIAAPAAAYTAAHPHEHFFYGSGSAIASALVHQEPLLSVSVGGEATLVGACYDVFPGLSGSILPPPTVVRDQDPDVGVGGGCFPFATAYGNDTGRTVTVHVAETTLFSPTWIACVDMDGDGVCLAGGVDQVNECYVANGFSTGSDSRAGGACTVTFDDSAASKNLFVLITTEVHADNEVVERSAGLEGSIWLS